jgi:squalene monooxygenase
VWIPYPEESSGRDASGKRPEGRSFHHGRFIQKLRAAAMKTPNVTVVETTVMDVVKNGWTGQVLGVECETRKEKDSVSCFFVLLELLWSCRFISFRYYEPLLDSGT